MVITNTLSNLSTAGEKLRSAYGQAQAEKDPNSPLRLTSLSSSPDKAIFSNESLRLASGLSLASQADKKDNSAKDAESGLIASAAKNNELASMSEKSSEKTELSKGVIELIHAQGLTENDLLGSKTFESGASIITYKANDESADSETPSYFVSIMQQDGTITTQKVTENTVFSDNGHGTIKAQKPVTATEEEALFQDLSRSIQGTDDDDFILSVNARSISSKDGNDTIVHVDKTPDALLQLNLGNGNNTFVSDSNSLNLSVHAGNGNNTIENVQQVNGFFGSGNNHIEAEQSSQLFFSGGNNIITIENMLDLHLGNGNNTVKANSISSITGGDGNNNLNIAMVKESIQLGSGNNSVEVEYLYDAEYVEAYKTQLKDGSTGHLLFPPPRPDGADISLGNGNNTLSVARTIEEDAKLYGNIGETTDIRVGNGNNNIDVSFVGQSVSLAVGDGNNALQLGHVNGDFSVGNGNNSISINRAEHLGLNAGKGHTILDVRGSVGFMEYNAQGSSQITVHGSVEGGSVASLLESSLAVKGPVNNLSILNEDMFTIVE